MEKFIGKIISMLKAHVNKQKEIQGFELKKKKKKPTSGQEKT